MGRKADGPAVQAAKGNSNRRVSATKARAAAVRLVSAKAKRIAEAAARLITSSDLAVPGFIKDDAVAVAVWNNLAPILSDTHRLKVEHRPLFISFCYYYSIWVYSATALRAVGLTQTIQPVGGASREMGHPLSRERDNAHSKLMELSSKFGLTPADEYSLFKDQAAAAMQNGWLFGDDTPKIDESDPREAQVIGGMAGMDSHPPSRLIN